MKGNVKGFQEFMNGVRNMCRTETGEMEHVEVCSEMGRSDSAGNGLTVFQNSEFGKVRVVEINGEPWFVGKDVAEVLGYKNPWDAIARHVNVEDRQNCQNDGFESPRGMSVINESGLYSLVLTSKLPGAKKFREWIMDIVLSSSRKIGKKQTTKSDKEGQLTVFQNSEFGKVRIVIVNGEPWMVGVDVAEALGYSNPRAALIRHVDDEDKGVTKCDTLGGTQETTIINESGLYSLALSSKLPGAKKFRRWVIGVVLPSIRKTGGYIDGEEHMTSDELKIATARVLAAKLNEKIQQGQMDVSTFVQYACEGRVVSWNPAQLMECLLWRYASACCGNNIKSARYELYGNLNEYCGICLWQRRQEATKMDCRMASFPMYAFLSIEEQQLTLLVVTAMCMYSGSNVSDLLFKYCSPIIMNNVGIQQSMGCLETAR